MNKRVLFVYGYGGSPASPMCGLLRDLLPADRFEVVSYTYPQEDCAKAVAFLNAKLASEPFDLVVGTSLGAFVTLCLDTDRPRFVVNPCLSALTELPKLTPRPDHPDDVQPSPEMVETYRPFEERLLAANHESEDITGFFAENDELFGSKYLEPFKERFGAVVRIPGTHHGNRPGMRQVAGHIASRPDLQ